MNFSWITWTVNVPFPHLEEVVECHSTADSMTPVVHLYYICGLCQTSLKHNIMKIIQQQKMIGSLYLPSASSMSLELTLEMNTCDWITKAMSTGLNKSGLNIHNCRKIMYSPVENEQTAADVQTSGWWSRCSDLNSWQVGIWQVFECQNCTQTHIYKQL